MLFTGCTVAATLFIAAIAAPSPANEQLATWPSRQGDEPLVKRDNGSNGASETDLLNFALTLEHIQDALYRQGVSNYSEFSFNNDFAKVKSVYANVKAISSQTSEHVKTLASTLTSLSTSVSEECVYTWPSIEGAAGFILAAKSLSGIFRPSTMSSP